MNRSHTTRGIVFGLRPGLASGVALLDYDHTAITPNHPELGYRLRGYIVTNLTPDHLKTWIFELAANHNNRVLIALSKTAAPTHHAAQLRKMAGTLGVPVVDRPMLATDVYCSDQRISAAHFDHVIAKRPLVRLATNQALYAAIHDWGWPDPHRQFDAAS
jgi:hypothetical protein